MTADFNQTKAESMKNGWCETHTQADYHAYKTLLAQYLPDALLDEYEFDLADSGDVVRVLWVEGTPAGFCTFKPKGSSIGDFMDSYSMLTVDTIFVLPRFRRRGAVRILLEEVMRSEENLGFSSPVSKRMCAVLQSYLKDRPHLRSKLWEIQYGGGEGDRELIWYNLHRRNLIHTAGA